MKKSTVVLPQNFLEKLTPESRRDLGLRAGMTQKEAEGRFTSREERKIQDQFLASCNAAGILALWSRTDRPTTRPKGEWDVTCLYRGKGCVVEFKVAGNTLSDDQIDMGDQLDRAGVPKLVAYSYTEAWIFTCEMLGL